MGHTMIATLATAPGGRPLLRRLGQWLCGLRGHDLVKKYEQSRLAMVCTHCGHQSAGWALNAAPPQRRFAGDPRRHEMRR